MSFENPFYLFFLLAIPFLLFKIFKRKRRYAGISFGNFTLLKNLKIFNPGKFFYVCDILKIIAIIFIIIALARPQIYDYELLSGEGADFMIVLDMSGSMNAIDMSEEEVFYLQERGKEPPNRFQSAIEILKQFVEQRLEDRIGLVIFSSKAYLKFPLTLDYSAIINILDELVLDNGIRNREGLCTNNCTITGEATAIGDGVAKAYARLENSEAKSKNIILITDGDNNAGKVAPLTIAKYIGERSDEKKAKIWSFLVGSSEPPLVPAINPWTQQIMKATDGRIIYEHPDKPYPINPQLLEEMSKLTGGKFYHAATEKDFRKDFEKLQKTEFKTTAHKKYKEAFLPFVFIAIFLILLEEFLRLMFFRKFP